MRREFSKFSAMGGRHVSECLRSVADGALSYCRNVVFPSVERRSEWHWTLRPRAFPEQVIGAIGLNKGDWINGGFWLAPERQNQSLMTEAVIPTNIYWSNVLGFARLRAPKVPGYSASRRISERTECA